MTSPYSLRKLRNYLWMTKAQLCAKQKKIHLPSLILNITNNKNELWETVGLTHFQNLQSQSVSISFKFVHQGLSSFVFVVLFKPSFNVLRGYFFCFIQFYDRSHFLNFDKFRYTAPLIISGLSQFCVVLWNLWQCQCSSQHALLGVVINNFRGVCSSFSTP